MSIISQDSYNTAINIDPHTDLDRLNNHILIDENNRQQVCLIDISTNKQWVAYVTKNNIVNERAKWHLTISEFSNEKTNVLCNYKQSISCSIHDQIDTILDDTCMFLSISPDGKRVSLSFMEITEDGEMKEDAKNNVNCIIYKISEDKKLNKEKSIKFQGSAIFADNGKLILCNDVYVKVMNADYQEEYHFRIYSLRVKTGIFEENYEKQSHLVNSPNVYYKFPIESTDISIKIVIMIPKLMKQGILIVPLKLKAYAWSIFKNGFDRFSIVKKENEMITSFSLDNKFLATFIGDSQKVNIYDTSVGILVYTLKSQRTISETIEFHLMTIHFSNDSQYLIMVGIEETITANSQSIKKINFEVWHIETGNSIYFHQKPILLVDQDNKILQPFIIESKIDSRSKFTIYYTTNLETGNTQMKIFTIDILKHKNIQMFNIEEIRYLEEANQELLKLQQNPNDSDWMLIRSRKNDKDEKLLIDLAEISNNALEVSDLKCYICKYNNSIYLLKFGRYMIQMWKIPNHTINNEPSNSSELVYIHVYKPLVYEINSDFSDFWSLDLNDKNCIQFLEVERSSNCCNFISQRILVKLTAADYKNNKAKVDREIYINFQQLDPINTLVEENIYCIQWNMKSACQALYYLDKIIGVPFQDTDLRGIDNPNYYDNAKSYSLIYLDVWIFHIRKPMYALKLFQNNPVFHILYKKAIQNIQNFIDLIISNPHLKSEVFTTLPGNDIVITLASFEAGRKLLIPIFLMKDIPIVLFRYHNEVHNIKGNALTILIEQNCNDLYKLLFNRMIDLAKKIASGHLSVLEDTILYLQSKGSSDLLKVSCENLSYLQINQDVKPLEKREHRALLMMYLNSSKSLVVSSFEYILKIKSYGKLYNSTIKPLIDTLSLAFWRIYYRMPKIKLNNLSVEKFYQTQVRQVILCTIPLLKINIYPMPINNREHSQGADMHKQNDSVFVQMVTSQSKCYLFEQGEIFLEALLWYKWNNYIVYCFYAMYLIHLIYYITFSIGVIFSKEVFKHEDAIHSLVTNIGHTVTIILMFISGFIILVQELRQMLKLDSLFSYFSYIYNWIDIASLTLPVISFVFLLTGNSKFDAVCTFTTLILWLQGILKLRVYSFVGVAWETIIQLIVTVKSILIILLLVLCAFTNAYIVLLKNQPDKYFQEQYSGSISDPRSSDSTNLIFSDSSSSNNFNNPFKAFSTLWFFIYGVWDPVDNGDIGDNELVTIISIIFSLITVLIFFNFVIAYMNSAIEDVRQRGKKIWISHFAAGIAEIEQLWCPKKYKYNIKYNPEYLYYWAPVDKVAKQEQKLQKETEDLIQHLSIIYEVNDVYQEPSKYEKVIDKLGKLYEQLESEEASDASKIDSIVLFSKYFKELKECLK